ncbi:MAG TPA: LysR family transcriptional regulator [Solirubrobacterales bacterium]|jgi:DNA-binding transcriptional LysR family regulator|nr:LysR family transcriptional regulator [Solirubrobacterales bacterium]
MRIQQLEYATAVARFGSFRRAAEALHISQPALSENVRRLERELGVEILDRRRSGATVGEHGRELLPHMLAVIEAADNLKRAADESRALSRTVRVGTVTAATVALLAPTIHAFRESHSNTLVEICSAQQTGIHRALLEGSMDLGLVNYLDGDDMPPEFESTELLRGRPVVCLRPDDELASATTVRSADLWGRPLIAMRAGYVMHRYVMRLLDGREPRFSYSADGAEMGKLMVAAGLGIAVLPDYSVIGDPLERSGEITHRPLADDGTEVLLVLQRRRSTPANNAISDLHDLFVAEARRTRDGDAVTDGAPVPS